MSTSVRWDGLDELRAQLRAMPAELTTDASAIVNETAATAVSAMLAEYPEGELRDRLFQQPLTVGTFGVGVLVKNGSGWAWHWDHGTALRHRAGGGSTGAEWGGTAPPHTFGRIMAQQRRAMYESLKHLLERAGLRVSGEA